MAVLALSLAAVLAGVLSVSDADTALIPAGALRVTISSRTSSRPVAPGFVGLSIEYRSAPAYFGTDPAHPDPVFGALVQGLAPGQSPVLRFGGDTTDWTWWPTPGVTPTPGLRYALTPAWARETAAAARAIDARLVLGINLEADSVPLVSTEARELQRIIGTRSIAGFELGNEPEVYGSLGWYTAASGAAVPGRPSSYGFGAYLTDYARIRRALPAGTPLVGPASGAPAWLAGLPRYLAANRGVAMVTFHRYPLHRCYTARSSPEFPSIANLLAPLASSGPATSLAAAIAAAHARGIPFRVDELNSVSCGGARGVSDTFASALWATDTLFEMVRAGVDGVNIHTFHNAVYEPFAISHAGSTWRASVRPLYYGLLLFARAAPPGSRLLATSGPIPSAVRIWTTRGPDGTLRTVVLNDAPRRSVTVAVRPPAPAASATLQRLSAPHLSSRTGVSLDGRSFGRSTVTGRLTGATTTEALQPAQGSFVVRVPAGSAALLTVPRPGSS